MSMMLSWHSRLILAVISVLVFVMNIDYTAVNLALVPISEEIAGDLNTLQWLLSAYVLVWAAFVVPGGRLADLHGKKTILIIGLVLFMLGSALTGLGADIVMLILGRLLQGLGAALFSAPAYGLIFSSVPPAKQGIAMGVIGGASGLGLAMGPTLAGLIIREASWRWLFYINIPLCLIIIGVLIFFTPKEEKAASHTPIDWVSVGLLACGLGITVFSLNQSEVWGITDWRFMGLAIFGLSVLMIFFLRDRRQPLQILPITLLKNKSFMATVGASFLCSYCFALVLIMMSLYLQNTLHLNSSETGYVFLSMTLAVGILSPVGGKLADRIGVCIPMIIGSLLTAIALFLLSFLTQTSSLWMVCSGLLLAGLGLGIGFPSLNTAMFRTLAPQEINTGSGIFTMAMMIANSVSVIIATSLLVMVGRTKLTSLVQQSHLSLNAQQQETLAQVISKVEHTATQLQGFSPAQVPQLLQFIDHAFLQGFKAALWIGVVLSLLCVGIVYRYLRHLPQQNSTNEVPIIGGMH